MTLLLCYLMRAVPVARGAQVCFIHARGFHRALAKRPAAGDDAESRIRSEHAKRGSRKGRVPETHIMNMLQTYFWKRSDTPNLRSKNLEIWGVGQAGSSC